jgi:hypothetical protein
MARCNQRPFSGPVGGEQLVDLGACPKHAQFDRRQFA